MNNDLELRFHETESPLQRGSGVEVRRDAPVEKPSSEPSRDHGKEGEVGDSH